MSKEKIQWSDYQQPIILKKDDFSKDKYNNYLAKEQLEKAFNQIEEFRKLHNNSNEDRKFDIPMNIGIVGGRGTGKTSVLMSLKNKLESENYYVFDIVDPTKLSSDLNVVEILISNIYQKVIEMKGEDAYFVQKMISNLKKISNALAIQRQGNSFFIKDHPAIDVLDKVNNIVNLDELIDTTLKDFKNMLNQQSGKSYQELVFIVDDLDLLENKYIYKFLTQIEEYLSTKIIIVFAYRDNQLANSLLESKLIHNKELMQNEVVNRNELERQVYNMLIKLMPLNKRISLYQQHELLQQKAQDIFKSISIDATGATGNFDVERIKIEDEEITIEEWIYDKFFKATNLYLKPIDESEKTGLFLPNSLRECIQMAEMIDEFETIKEESSDAKQLADIYYSNLMKLKEIVINRIQNDITREFSDFLNSWMMSSSYQKNYLTYHYFFNKFRDSFQETKLEDKVFEFTPKPELEYYPTNGFKLKNKNLRLGDIYEMMELYKVHVAKTTSEYFSVYIMKIFYSIELSSLLYQSLKEQSEGTEAKENVFLTAYLDLINTSFMPANFNYFEYSTNRKDEDYIVPINLTEKNKNKQADQFVVDWFIGSFITAYSDIRKGAYNGLTNFKYRQMYSTELKNMSYEDMKENLTISRTANYQFEFYIPCGQRDYVEGTLAEYIDDKNDKNDKNNKISHYLLTSVFQIDHLVMLTYSRRSSTTRSDKIKKVISSIDLFFITKIKKDKNKEKCFYDLFGRKKALLSPYQILTKESKEVISLADVLGTKFLSIENFPEKFKKAEAEKYLEFFRKVEGETDKRIIGLCIELNKIFIFTEYDFKIEVDGVKYDIKFENNAKKVKATLDNIQKAFAIKETVENVKTTDEQKEEKVVKICMLYQKIKDKCPEKKYNKLFDNAKYEVAQLCELLSDYQITEDDIPSGDDKE